MNRQFKMMLWMIVACGSFTAALTAATNSEPAAQPQVRILTIQEAVQLTLSRSPEILMAEAQAARAREAERESRSLYRPQMTAGTGLAYNNGFPLSIEGAAPSIFQIGAVQSILSKKNSNLIHEAEASAKAGQLNKESARNELASRTALTYCELFRARRIIPLASVGLDSAGKQLELMETQLDAGKVRPVDVTLAKRALNYARQQLLVAQEQEKLTEAELRELSGLPEAMSIRTVEPRIDSSFFESDAETLYQKALAVVPEILQADANIRAKEFHVEAERGERFPRLEIVGQYALFSRTNQYDDYFNRFERHNFLLGLSAQIPILDGSRAGARIAQSRQEASAERSRLQRLKSELKLNIQRGLGDLKIAKGTSDFAHIDVEAAREMLQVNETLLAGGRLSNKEIEDSRMQLQQKELAVIDAQQAILQRKIELLRAIGSIASVIQ